MLGPFGSSSFNHLISSGFYNGAISRSLRLDDGSNPELNFTPTLSDRQKFTMSVWIKRSNLSTAMRIFGGETNNGLGNQYTFFEIDSSDRFLFTRLQDGTTNTVYAPANLRDTTNWYNLVGAVDTTQSTEANRVRLYINGVEQTLTESGSGFPAENLNTMINISSQSTRHIIGHTGYNNDMNFDGYLSDFNFIDGQQLLPTSFGEFKQGIWIPINTSGLTFGTNGCRLEFKQTGTGGASASTIGADTSGNGNHFTDSGLAAHNSNMLDCCENNFATTLGAGLAEPSDYQSYNSPVSSEGNLKVTAQTGWTNGSSNFGMTSGKWYAECRINAVAGSNYVRFGMRSRPARTYDEYFWTDNGGGQIDAATSPYSDRVGTFAAGDILQIALDLDNNAVWFGKDNTWENSATASEIAAGNVTNAFASGTTLIPNAGATGDGHAYFFYCNPHPSGSDVTWNFGQDSSFANPSLTRQGNSDSGDSETDFYFTPPDGFLACNATNLADTVLSPNQAEQATDHFNTILYTGDGSSDRQITGVGFNPDWTWIKNRSNDGFNHILTDSTRGAGKELFSDDNTEEDTVNTNKLEDFITDGFQLATSPHGSVNSNTHTYVAWNWHVNDGTTSTNNDGDIQTIVQVNQKAGISIITYTGTGTQSDTVGHGLGVKPKWVLVKSRSEAQNWHVYHEKLHPSAPEDYAVFLNAPNARSSSSANLFNSTAPTTTVMSVGNDNSSNKSSTTYVMYLFAEIEGYSKFGTYDGNSNADGTYVFTGFRPAMVIFKHISGSDEWVIADNKRDPVNVVVGQLFPSTTGVESRSNNICDFLSNGFKMRRNAGSINQNSYIYMAFAETPFKFSNAR